MKDILILVIIAVVLVFALIFILFNIIGQSEKHVEKVRKTKVKYDESLSWRPDSKLSEESVLKDLRKNPGQREVSYSQMELTKKSFKYISQMSQLEALKLTDSIVKDDWLKYLRGKPIRKLDLFGTQITDDCVPHLLAMPKLRWIGLGHTEITDKGLEELSSHPRLQFVELDRTNITDEGVKSLSKLRSLRNLDLADTSTTSSSMDLIGKMTELKSLSLKGVKLDGTSIAKLNGLKKLRQLNLGDCQIGDKDLTTIHKLKNLNGLRISINDGLTDKCLKPIGKLKKLRFLEITQCPNITDGAVEKFKQKHPNCKVKHSRTVGNIPGGFHFEGLEQEAKFLRDQIDSAAKSKDSKESQQAK